MGEDITAANNVRKTITINGVDIAEYQQRLQSLNKKTTPGKKKTTWKKGGKTKKAEPSSDNDQKITAFFSTPQPKKTDVLSLTKKEDSGLCITNDTNNIEDNLKHDDCDMKTENLNRKETHNMKKTFSNIDMTEKIMKFTQLTAGSDCVYGSGSCATHNCKLVRGVIQKRMSVPNKDGGVSWAMRDVTCLRCPNKDQAKPLTGVYSATTDVSDPSELNQGTNKRARITGSGKQRPISSQEDQSHGD